MADIKDEIYELINKKNEERDISREEDNENIIVKNEITKGIAASDALSMATVDLEEKVVTKDDFINNLSIMDKDIYEGIIFSKDEAKEINKFLRYYSTGPNSTIAMKCHKDCPYGDACILNKMGKAPYGKTCVLEHSLIQYHTRMFIEEFDVNPRDHSERLLIQELAELLIYEQRLNIILSKPDNSSLFGIKTTIAADGTPIEEEVEHWAFNTKERIKNRRLKILDALNATRKAKAQSKIKEKDVSDDSESNKLNSIIDKLEELRELKNKGEYVDYEEV